MELTAKIEQVKKEFPNDLSWENKYKKIIEWGKKLAPYPEEFRTEDQKVVGCQAQVWLHAKFQDGKIVFAADSDALITKGLIAVLLQVYSGSVPSEILKTPPDFIKDIGFESNLSPSRANGLRAMVKQIQYYALGYQVAFPDA